MPTVQLNYYIGHELVFSNYVSTWAAQYSVAPYSLNWWDTPTMFEMHRGGGTGIESLHQMSSQIALNIDIRSGFHMNGTIDPFGPLRYLVARFGEGDDMERVREKYLRPMPCKGQIRPNVRIAMYYRFGHQSLRPLNSSSR